MQDALLGMGDTEVSQADPNPSPRRPFILVEETEQTSEMKQVQTELSTRRTFTGHRVEGNTVGISCQEASL